MKYKVEAPCGGSQCRVLRPGVVYHNKKSGVTCSVRGVTGVYNQSEMLDLFRHLLVYLDPDSDRQGLVETPMRAQLAWEFWTSGYKEDPKTIFKVFEDGAEKVDEMVLLRKIPFYSHCEHHLAPFYGTADIAYIPDGKIVGFSKLSRLVGIFAHRLQVQERMTNQIVDAIVDGLNPVGAGIVMRARHFCMESRGIQQQGLETVTSALRGAIKEKAAARAEFLHLANGD